MIGVSNADELSAAAHPTARWNAERVRALRQRRGENQHQFAERLGTRQQTVSEWERGSSHPRRMAQRLLTLLAEESPPYLAESTDDPTAIEGATS
jgi:DNA-binding transcriptional regulator YiaG